MRKPFTLLCLLVGLITCVPPEKPAQSAPKECPKPPPEPDMYAMVISTVHEYHLVTSGYPLSKIGDAMDAFRPDLTVIDEMPDVMKERPEEASVETEYVKYIAGTRASDVEPIAPARVDPDVEFKVDPADDAALKPFDDFMDTLLGMSFEEANSHETTIKIMNAHNARQRLAKGEPNYTRREAWLEKGLDDVIARRHPKRIMVVVDGSHRPAIEAHLREIGAGIKQPVEMVRASKESREENTVPPLVIKAWTQQLDRLRDRLSRMKKDTPQRQWLQTQANILQAAVDRNGQCCVSPERFKTGKK
jgi:hypothetical protein